jgi:hypothetical protein
MNYRLEVSATFKRNIKNLGKRYASITDDYARLLDELEKDPGLGADLGGGLRKIRMAITSKGHGKRGGARVITFTVIVSVEEAVINLLTIYDKSERESIKRSEILALLEKNGLR